MQDSPEIHWQTPLCELSCSGPHPGTSAESPFRPCCRAREIMYNWVREGHVRRESWPRHRREATGAAEAEHVEGCVVY